MPSLTLVERLFPLLALFLAAGAITQPAQATDCTQTRKLLWRHHELLDNINGYGAVVPPFCETRPLLASTDALIAEFKRTGTACGMPADSLAQLARLRDKLEKRKQSCDYGVGQGPLVPGAR